MTQAATQRGIGRALGALAALAALAIPAHAQDDAFDPSLCPTDTGGKAIVRLVSGLAFAVEPGSVLLDRPITDRRAPPGVPRGCAENPLITDSLTLPLHYNAVLENRADPPLPFGVLRMMRLFGHDGPVTIQRSNIAFHDEWKADGFLCGQGPGGLSVCHACDGDPARPGFCRDDGHERTSNRGQAAWRAWTIALGPPREGVGANALPAAWECIAQLSYGYPNGFQSCTAHYQLRDGLSVVYEIEVSDTPPELIPDLLLSTDRLVRDSIDAARAPAFDGPDIREIMGYGSD